MQRYSNRGSSCAIFPLLNGDQLLKERICSLWSKFFPLRVDPILKRTSFASKQTGCHRSFSPSRKWLIVVYCHTLIAFYNLMSLPICCNSHMMLPICCNSHMTLPICFDSQMMLPICCNSHMMLPIYCYSHMMLPIC